MRTHVNHTRKFKTDITSPRRRQCWACGKTKRIEHFPKQANGYLGRRRDCKSCHRDWVRNHRQKNFHKKHGVTFEQYSELLRKQKGLCAICFQPETYGSRRLCVDHDHRIQIGRGLLCNRCNRLIGYAKDDISLMESCVSYLKRYQTPPSNVIPIQHSEVL